MNYITQNVIGVLLFYDYGLALMGKMPYATIPLSGAAILLLQGFLCGWWLAHFAQEPL